MSAEATLGVRDVAVVALVTLGSMRLLVSVAVPSVVANPLVASAELPSAVTTPVPVVIVAGAAPEPPPTIKAFAVSMADDAQVLALEK